MKLHLGCGDIYLEGYVNIDVKGTMIEKASDSEYDNNKTTLDSYFKHPFGSSRRPIIVDLEMYLNRPWISWITDIEQIVMISCLEHFTKNEGLFIISEIQRVLKVGGELIVSFPDIARQIEAFYYTKPNWCMELIYCNGKNEFSFHRWGYTDRTFRELWNDDYIVEKIDLIKHEYPMLQYKVTKVK